ncbi:hypothetical protein [Synechococcus sp. A15-60]|uniref:hypothetical protein n=1 Tax=Synechococcus sp. A15-60 TaxID=1050655 RepID=UPI001645D5C8|nr:hypothetical protein [Synechococcus sp. A15-60]QNI47746.1 putative conserved membrane protein [Synechococcus sp. A15-60]
MNPSSIRRFVFTLITGYLAIFGVRQIPYEFPNEWGVIIPVLIVVYILTIWLDGLIFKDETSDKTVVKVLDKKIQKRPKRSKGFGD